MTESDDDNGSLYCNYTLIVDSYLVEQVENRSRRLDEHSISYRNHYNKLEDALKFFLTEMDRLYEHHSSEEETITAILHSIVCYDGVWDCVYDYEVNTSLPTKNKIIDEINKQNCKRIIFSVKFSSYPTITRKYDINLRNNY